MFVYVGRLRKSGLAGEALQKAIAAVKGRVSHAADPVKIPKASVKSIGEILGKGERAVVTLSRNETIRVYSLDGYTRLMTKGRTAATAQHGSKPRRGPKRRAARKEYVHWMHKPENAEKAARVRDNLLSRSAARVATLTVAALTDGAHK